MERVSYFGLIPFIFAAAALGAFKKIKEITIFGSIFIATFFLSTNFFINKFLYLLPIPVFSTTVPTRVLGLFVFSGSILAAFGLDLFLQKKSKKNFIISFSFVFTLLTGAVIFVLLGAKFSPELAANLAITKRNLLLPIIFFTLCLILFFLNYYGSRIFKKITTMPTFIGILCIIITVFDLFYFFHKITPFSPKEYIYPQTEVVKYLQNNGGLYRFWGYGSAYVHSNFQAVDKTYSPEGEDPLHLRWYTELLSATDDGKLPNILPRPDANIVPGYGPGQFEKNQYRQRILNLDGVKYILNKDDGLGAEYKPDKSTFPDKDYKLIWQKSPWQIYENLNVLPRTFLVNDYQIISDNKKEIQTLFSPNFNIRKTIIINKTPQFSIDNKTDLKGLAQIITYTPNKVIIRVSTNTSAFLFLSDTYSVSWRAQVDGVEVPVYKADYAFRAIPVTKGEHTITFFFDSNNFEKGVLFSGIFAILLILILLKTNSKKL
ncbi:MAG TPA: YfhO family protein [Patescibacteria group bacterium]